ncbi:eukaryotic translation initiation factor 4E type 2-like [Ctenocephalides felis]|uniref:eukaryotic translation initiation factor 4E type 2-like n=1 Tax=Ctenocephalides felis TaxID=7515 RepID=UPI000E6E52F3|nr:eukaryotic translation initiation factor 4E type 2-like [Ctenocephalides felis]
MSNKFEALKTQVESGDDSGSGDEDIGGYVVNPDTLPPLEIPPTEHKLQYPYWLWFSRYTKSAARLNSTQGYTQALRLVGRCGSVEQWWSMYCHLARPSELPPTTDLHLFKSGIRPMWEDPANTRGGKWVIRLRKGLAGRAWENLCMAMLGEQFMVGGEICGAVLSVRFQEDLVSLWNRTATDQTSVARVRDTLKRVLNLPANANMEYKSHGDSLRASKVISTVVKS